MANVYVTLFQPTSEDAETCVNGMSHVYKKNTKLQSCKMDYNFELFVFLFSFTQMIYLMAISAQQAIFHTAKPV